MTWSGSTRKLLRVSNGVKIDTVFASFERLELRAIANAGNV
jgi:hypothetical protein